MKLALCSNEHVLLDHLIRMSSSPFSDSHHRQIVTDWFGQTTTPAPSFRFELADGLLLFQAWHEQPACVHPAALENVFQPELWKYDAAEFFLRDPESGHYLEINLAPNGAHWWAVFDQPRQAIAFPHDLGIRSMGHLTDSRWDAQLTLSLPALEKHFHFTPDSPLNVNFILGSPEQRFFSAHPLPGDQPDYHQPDAFPPLSTLL